MSQIVCSVISTRQIETESKHGPRFKAASKTNNENEIGQKTKNHSRDAGQKNLNEY